MYSCCGLYRVELSAEMLIGLGAGESGPVWKPMIDDCVTGGTALRKWDERGIPEPRVLIDISVCGVNWFEFIVLNWLELN